jgi:hypothetical protein
MSEVILRLKKWFHYTCNLMAHFRTARKVVKSTLKKFKNTIPEAELHREPEFQLIRALWGLFTSWQIISHLAIRKSRTNKKIWRLTKSRVAIRTSPFVKPNSSSLSAVFSSDGNLLIAITTVSKFCFWDNMLNRIVQYRSIDTVTHWYWIDCVINSKLVKL